MSYTEREAHRLKRKAEIASGKNVKQNTLDRLKDMVIVIEDAVKPEADRLRATIVYSWKKAHDVALANGMDWNRTRTAKTGYDCDKNPIPSFNGIKYEDRFGTRFTDAYVAFKKSIDPMEHAHKRANAYFNMTMEKEIIAHNLISPQKLIEHAEKDAAETVEANKYKLLDGVARYMGEYQTAIVIKTDVRTGMKGFQGEFIIDTDKGRILFTCKAITAEGPVVSFHWRYIIQVKHIK